MFFWIPLTVLGHFLNALAATIDKHLVSNTTLKPVVYAFYSGIFQIIYLLAIPIIAYLAPEISFRFPSWGLFLLTVTDGALFIAALILLYKATEKSEVSRITPIVGTAVPLFTLMLSTIFLGQYLTDRQLIAFAFFVIGGFIISANFNKGKIYHEKGLKFAILSGFLFASYYIIMSFVYTQGVNFWSVFVILQFGNFIGAMCLLIHPASRKLILNNSGKNLKIKPKKTKTSFLFLADKIFAAIAAMLINYSISIGNVTIINSLQATQYVFILFLTFILSKKIPRYFQENIKKEILVQKIMAIILITVGLFLIV